MFDKQQGAYPFGSVVFDTISWSRSELALLGSKVLVRSSEGCNLEHICVVKPDGTHLLVPEINGDFHASELSVDVGQVVLDMLSVHIDVVVLSVLASDSGVPYGDLVDVTRWGFVLSDKGDEDCVCVPGHDGRQVSLHLEVEAQDVFVQVAI
jgi:hypothetical protein